MTSLVLKIRNLESLVGSCMNARYVKVSITDIIIAESAMQGYCHAVEQSARNNRNYST